MSLFKKNMGKAIAGNSLQYDPALNDPHAIAQSYNGLPDLSGIMRSPIDPTQLQHIIESVQRGTREKVLSEMKGSGASLQDLGLPWWAIDGDANDFRPRLTPAGMLWVRLYAKSWGKPVDRYTTQRPGSLFSTSDRVSVMHVIEATNRADPVYIVVCLVGSDDKLVNIEDDVNLFPSDSLIIKLRAIQG